MHHPRETEKERKKGVNHCVEREESRKENEKEKKRKRGGKKVSGLWMGGGREREREKAAVTLCTFDNPLSSSLHVSPGRQRKSGEKERRNSRFVGSGESNEKKMRS